MAAVSKAKRASNDKWDAANMAILRCKVRNKTAEDFKKYAQERGTSVHALLKGYVERCLAADQAEKDQAEKEKTGKG